MVKIGIYPKDWAGDVSNDSGDSVSGKVMGIAALNPSYGLNPSYESWF